MASVGPQGNQGGKRSLDAEINLVPFIDLLSMCICFLLMTAIWVEVGSIEIRQILGTEASAVTKESLDLQIRLDATKKMNVTLEKSGRPVQAFVIENDGNNLRLPQLGQYVAQLMGAIIGPNGESPDLTARVIPTANVNYAELVSVLDIVRGYGVSNLAVVPVKE
ncbi:MAG: biopolymer transporter ExbD [Bdellovibrionia bacterium]